MSSTTCKAAEEETSNKTFEQRLAGYLEARKEYRRMYYQTHKKTILEKKKKRIDDNPDLFRKRTKQYYQNHKEELCAYQKVRRQTITETQQAVSLARREARTQERAEREARAKERAERRQLSQEEINRLLIERREQARAYRTDPAFRRKESDRERTRRKMDPAYAQRIAMRDWVMRLCPDVSAFTWKTHFPIIYNQRVTKTCSACGSTRLQGSKLWWKDRSSSDPELYQCHSCYAADVSQAMPLGHESHIFGSGKTPRP